MQNGDKALPNISTVAAVYPTINSVTALTDTDCSSIYSPNLSTIPESLKSFARPTVVFLVMFVLQSCFLVQHYTPPPPSKNTQGTRGDQKVRGNVLLNRIGCIVCNENS